MRSDARRNRERVLAAAEAVFSEMGLRAQIEEVARRAGVGVGTVCRHFPTKQALVEAVLEAMYESLLARRPRARASNPTRATAFHTFVFALSEFQARHRALAEHMATEIDLPASAQSVRDALRRGDRRAGHARAGRGRDSLRHRPGRRRAALLRCRARDRARRRSPARAAPRYVALILDGLRPLEASQLPGRPLDFAQLQRLKKHEAASDPQPMTAADARSARDSSIRPTRAAGSRSRS